jgi:energy-coupling factor transporter ATP-binding protein EcfA2
VGSSGPASATTGDLQRLVHFLRSDTDRGTSGGRGPGTVDGHATGELARLVEVDFSYSDGTRALGRVSLGLQAGRVHGLVGGNGSGKSTLLRLLARLGRAERGRVEVLGRDISRLKARQLIGTVGIVLPDPDNQITERTVAAEVGFPLRRRRVVDPGGRERWLRRRERRARAAARIRAVCEMVGLGELLDHDPRLLSRAQRRFVSLATALALDPPVVVLDEPSVGLDAPGRAQLLDVVRGLREQGKAVLLAENDIDLVADVADDLTLLQRGRVVLQGPVEDVLAEPHWGALHEARIRPPRAAELGQVIGVQAVNYRQLVSAGPGRAGDVLTHDA